MGFLPLSKDQINVLENSLEKFERFFDGWTTYSDIERILCRRDENATLYLIFQERWWWDYEAYPRSLKKAEIILAFGTAVEVFPEFELRKKPWLLRLAGIRDFPENREFSKRYDLRSPEGEAKRLFQTDVLEYFAQSRKTWHVEGAGPWLVLFRKWHPKDEGLSSLIAEARKIFDLFNRH